MYEIRELSTPPYRDDAECYVPVALTITAGLSVEEAGQVGGLQRVRALETEQPYAEVIDAMDRPDEAGVSTSHLRKDSAARRAGLLLLLTAVATIVMVYARIAADADQPTLLESLRAVAASKAMYSLSGLARAISGIALIAGALFLLKTWVIREGFGTRMVPYLLGASGVFTTASGAFALALVADASNAAAVGSVDASTETIAMLRWLSGKIGFAAAGLGLVAAAQRQWKAGGVIRRIAPASATIGIAMQFIWVDAATVAHRLSGVAFFVWLLVIGAMLLTGRVERHFATVRGSSWSSSQSA